MVFFKTTQARRIVSHIHIRIVSCSFVNLDEVERKARDGGNALPREPLLSHSTDARQDALQQTKSQSCSNVVHDRGVSLTSFLRDELAKAFVELCRLVSHTTER